MESPQRTGDLPCRNLAAEKVHPSPAHFPGLGKRAWRRAVKDLFAVRAGNSPFSLSLSCLVSKMGAITRTSWGYGDTTGLRIYKVLPEKPLSCARPADMCQWVRMCTWYRPVTLPGLLTSFSSCNTHDPPVRMSQEEETSRDLSNFGNCAPPTDVPCGTGWAGWSPLPGPGNLRGLPPCLSCLQASA